MKNLKGWLFLVIALVWLLELLNLIVGSVDVHRWIALIAIAIIGVLELKG